MLQIFFIFISFDQIAISSNRKCFLHCIGILKRDAKLLCTHFHTLFIGIQCQNSIVHALCIRTDSIHCLFLCHAANIDISDINAICNFMILCCLCFCGCSASCKTNT